MKDVKELITNKIDSGLISVFSQIYGYKMFPKDKEKCGGGILFYVHENIQSQFFHLNSNHDGNEVMLLEFSVKGN